MTIDREKVSSFFGLLNNSAQDRREKSFKQIRCSRHIWKQRENQSPTELH